MLKEQGYHIDSVPEKDKSFTCGKIPISARAAIRSMSPINLMMTTKIAADAVTALQARISGIDLIIPDKEKPAEDPGAYGIIEANFNPAMHMHIYPYQGQSRRLTMSVLKLLFPERF